MNNFTLLWNSSERNLKKEWRIGMLYVTYKSNTVETTAQWDVYKLILTTQPNDWKISFYYECKYYNSIHSNFICTVRYRYDSTFISLALWLKCHSKPFWKKEEDKYIHRNIGCTTCKAVPKCFWIHCNSKIRYVKGIYIAPSRKTSEALRHGSHSFTCNHTNACLYLVSIHQMAPSQTKVANI